MRQIKAYLFLLAFIAMTASGNICPAQDVNAIAIVDKDSIYTGQPIDYRLTINLPKDYIIDWTSINDTINKYIEILDRGDVVETPIDNGDNLTVSRTLKLTTFDTGYIEIPKIHIGYFKSAGDTNSYSCKTNFIDIYVKGTAIDTTAAYRDIKLPIKQNITVEEIAPYAGGGLLLAGIVATALLLVWRFKRKDTKDVEEIKHKIPAIVTAREKMTQLRDANLWQAGLIKEYYTDLTDIVREYLKGQFLIEAAEMTSEEILSEVKKIKLDDNTFKKLQDTLITADLVKFAKANATPSQNDEAFDNINTFIEDSYTHYQNTKDDDAGGTDDNNREETSTEKQEMEATE